MEQAFLIESQNENARIAKLLNRMEDEGISAFILLKPSNTAYITGFRALIYSRPIIVLISIDKEPALIVPELEEEHARKRSWLKDLRTYAEIPTSLNNGWEDPLGLLFNLIREKGLGQRRLAIETSFLSHGIFRSLKEALPGAEFWDGDRIIDDLRMVKSQEEIELLRKGGELSDLAVGETIRVSKEGLSESEVEYIGHMAAFKVARERLPNCTLEHSGMTPSGLRTAFPHVISTVRRLERGDVVIHSRHIILEGYHTENERTYFIGRPTTKLEEIFQVMKEAQEAAIQSIRDGVKAREVDQTARKIIQKAGYGDFILHRTGHGLGLDPHEPPYLRSDNDLELKSGMVVSIEPGIYVQGYGGARHSDTVLVTKTGAQLLTHYPKDIRSLTML